MLWLQGMTSKKQRLDRLMVERGLVSSRERAVTLILAGKVKVGGDQVEKAGQRFAPDVDLEVLETDESYVSRGGLKLAGALEVFSLAVAGLVAMDVGASTGGFTDCLLRRGAKRVYAVDVGYGQLAWALRQDPRVEVLERTNIRYLTHEQVTELVDLAVIDISFISLKKAIPRVLEFLKHGGRLLALIKPQFEVGRGLVGRGGVVRDPALHERVVGDLQAFCLDQGLKVEGVVESPLLGPKGNREFFISALKP
jgi:23S rRNA (cytidine1920-2'-O)/16S rRNA (cytidine1409-2'-O)-methyltransferase